MSPTSLLNLPASLLQATHREAPPMAEPFERVVSVAAFAVTVLAAFAAALL
jgi:hypothetical protein